MAAQSNIVCCHEPFVSMKCMPSFIVIAIPEVTRKNSCRQDTHQMVKYNAFFS